MPLVALPPGQAWLTCFRIASRSSSRVNGLVTYCSEPTMRPRALSNRPSLEDSVITGVCLNLWLFLISEQVWRSEEHTSELQSLMRIPYAVLCLSKKHQN